LAIEYEHIIFTRLPPPLNEVTIEVVWREYITMRRKTQHRIRIGEAKCKSNIDLRMR
jgi:hypothetical protein